MTQLSYQSAGVNLELYEQAMQKLPKLMQQTRTPGVMDLPGGFAGLFRLAAARQWTDPVLVSGTDGVGTKIKLAIMLQQFDTIGIDLVAMCVNDCLCLGATPLFFLDYIAMAADDPTLLEQLVRGVSAGCQQAGAALLGGETAIMPDLYASGDFDMAGFCVGAAERSELVNGQERIRPGDVLIGVPSSGFHSNGFSLIRKAVFEHAGLSATESAAERLPQTAAAWQPPAADGSTGSTDAPTIGEVLLTPTRIYADLVGRLLDNLGNEHVHGIAHITGGGIAENLERILPAGVTGQIRRSSWSVPEVFGWLQQLGDIADAEMFRVFNMGIGLVVAVPADAADSAQKACSTDRFPAVVLGEIVSAGDPHAVPAVSLS